MTNWPRSKDAFIAERAEGRKTKWIGKDLFWDHPTYGWLEQQPYNTDLAAVARAMEAWRGPNTARRSYVIMSPDFGSQEFRVLLWIGAETLAGEGTGKDLPTAAAEALYRALGGAE